ncbi:MAG: protein kinase domain-containing protein [Terriglobales bacterium]
MAMALEAGTKIGTYEIIAALGAGGMGEVYRARDARLGREVAIKLLPSGLAADAERLRRFEIEARAAGQLNHASLLAVYEFGLHAGTPYLVMELLEGETLRQRLSGGVAARAATAGAARGAEVTAGGGGREGLAGMRGVALPARKAAEIAVQVARGLAVAHAKGIVHRDLKPENIFLTREGQVKVLDFGLAKLAGGERAAGGDDAPTLPLEATRPGEVLGTVGYMSPEQVRGQTADARSDLFALGAILYEMVAGRRAFQRETAAETMTAILKEEPAPLERDGSGTEPGMQRVVEHCLEKDPAARFQTARDLEFALAGLGDGSGTGSASRMAATPGAGRRPGSAGWRRWWPVAAGVVIAAGVTWLAAARHFTAPAAPWHFSAVTNFAGIQGQPAISPDGRSVAFVSNRDGHFNIYVGLLSGGNVVQITHGPNLKVHPAWSPDGSMLAYARINHSGIWDIWEVPALGGAPRRIIFDATTPSFTPAGKLIYQNLADGGVWEAGAFGEDPHEIVAAIPGDSDSQPRVSPDGRWVAFAADPNGGGPRRALAVANLATGKTRILGGVGSLALSPAWSPDSRAIYFASNRAGAVNLWRTDRDGAHRRQITAGQGDDIDLDVSANGRRIVFGTFHADIALARLALPAAPGAKPQVLNIDPARDLWGPAYSPDGQHLAFFTSLKGVANEGIAVANADGGDAVQLVSDGYFNIFPEWTADGSHLIFNSIAQGYQAGSGHLHVLLRSVAVSGGSPKVLLRVPNGFNGVLGVPGRDGRILYESSSGRFVAQIPAAGRSELLGAVPKAQRSWPVVWSPDQKLVAYVEMAGREDDPAAGLWATDFHSAPRQLFRGWVKDAVAGPGGTVDFLQAQADGTLTLWQVSWNGQGLKRLASGIPGVYDGNYDHGVFNQFTASPDGRYVVFQYRPVCQENLGLLSR